MNINQKKALILLTTVAVAAIMSGIILAAYSANNANNTSDAYPEWMNEGMMPRTPDGPDGMMRGRGGCSGPIEISAEYEANVLNIARNDTDVQALLNEGYNITRVRPIIKTVVEADGSVVTKATTATVMLVKDTTGRAEVTVDLDQAKVTRIVILTRTVIEKS
jgi:hypothetical protein